jgi:hypothetical protein
VKMDKKGQVGNIPQYVISFVLIGLIVAVGLTRVSSFFSRSLSCLISLWECPVFQPKAWMLLTQQSTRLPL